MDKKLKRYRAIYPWYRGLSGDLLFWVAVNTLFLQIVRGFSASEIVLTITISNVIALALQIPIIKITEKIGNTASVRVGSALFLMSAVTLTLGTNVLMISIGRTLREMAISFRSMIDVSLENNLELEHKEGEYVKYSAIQSTIYAVVTMIISIISGFIFNINNFLPMILCIAACVICLLLSFFMVDYSPNNIAKKLPSMEQDTQKKKININAFILFAIASYGIFFALMEEGIENGKLFIQDELLSSLDAEKAAVIFGIAVFVSRFFRVLSTLVFTKAYALVRDKMGIVLGVIVASGFAVMILGYAAFNEIAARIIVISLGYAIVLFTYSPFNVYIFDVILKNSSKEVQHKIIGSMRFAKGILQVMLGLAFSTILLKNPIILIIVLLLILSFVEIAISIGLYYSIKRNKKPI